MATEKNFKIKNGLSIGDDEVISSVRRFYASDGTSAKAAYSFDGESSTGMYKYGSNQIGFTAGGNLMAYIQSGATYGLVVQSKISATGGNSDNWNTAYGWGDHSTQGYLTSADLSGYLTSESDTLASVTGRGNTTTNAISTGTITTSGNVVLNDGQITSNGSALIIDGASAKEVEIKSARDIRLVIDDNNDDTDNQFELYKHSVTSGNELLIIDQSGNMTASNNITADGSFVTATSSQAQGIYAGSTQVFQGSTRNLINIGTINSGAITSTGTGTFNALTLTGGSDNLTFTETGGDWSILNAQQNNGLVIYDGTGGVDINYNGSSVANFGSGGTTFTQNIIHTGTLETRKLRIDRQNQTVLVFEDSGGSYSVVHTINDGQGNYNIMLNVNEGGTTISDGDGQAKILMSGHGQHGAVSLNAGPTVATAGTTANYSISLMADGTDNTIRVGNPNNNVGGDPGDLTKVFDNSANAFATSYSVGSDSVISSTRRFYASDGTTVKAAYSFDGDSGTGISHTATGRIDFLSSGAIKAYIKTGTSNPISPTMYVDGRTEINGVVTWTGGSSTNANTAYGWGDHSAAGYLTSETSHADVVVDGDFASSGLMKRGSSAGSYSIVTDNSSNWNTAYGWGDHSTQGYLTSADLSGYLTAEADTLATVTGRGATTTNAISTGDITTSGTLKFSGNNHYFQAGTNAVDIKNASNVVLGGFNASGVNTPYSYQINGTTVINSSRNLVNIGTISSGSITSSGNITAGSGSGFITAGTTTGYVYAKSLRLNNGEVADTDFQFAYQMIVDANDTLGIMSNKGDFTGGSPFGIFFLGDNGGTTKTLGSGLVGVWNTTNFKKAHVDHMVGLYDGTQNLTVPSLTTTGNLTVQGDNLDITQSIRHRGDEDTGINFFNDQVAIKTGGTERLTITNSDINIRNTQVFFNSSMGIGASTYSPIENNIDSERNWLNFHRSNDASYVEITNRTPAGKVVLSGGLDGGGGEVQRLEIEGGSSTKSVKVLASTNLDLSSTSNFKMGGLNVITSGRNIQNIGNVNIGGYYAMDGTTIIDTSKNLVNIGTISSGAITASGAHTFTANDVDFIVQDTTDSITNYIWRDHSTDKLYLGTGNAVVDLRSVLKINNTERIDMSGNATLGDITAQDLTLLSTSGHTRFTLGSRSGDPTPSGDGSYDFRPGMRVAAFEPSDGSVDGDADLPLAWTGSLYLDGSQTYATAASDQVFTFTVNFSGGTRWFAKVKTNDAESGNYPYLAVNAGTEYALEYADAPPSNGENDTDAWHVIDITDDVVTGSNTLKVWLGGGQKTYVLAIYVYPSTGIMLPNEPYESVGYFHKGIGVGDSRILDEDANLSNIGTLSSGAITTSGSLSFTANPAYIQNDQDASGQIIISAKNSSSQAQRVRWDANNNTAGAWRPESTNISDLGLTNKIWNTLYINLIKHGASNDTFLDQNLNVTANNVYLGSTNNSDYLSGNSRLSIDGYMMVKGIINTEETGTGATGITFGNGSTLGTDQISLITSGARQFYISSTGVAQFSEDVLVLGDNLDIQQSLRHNGNTDTRIEFTTNQMDFKTSATARLTINTANVTIKDDLIVEDASPVITISDTNNGGGGGAEGKIIFKNTEGNAIGIGYTGDVTTDSDLIISTDAGGTYGTYLGLDAAGISDTQSDIILEPKTNVRIANGGLKVGTTEVISSTGRFYSTSSTVTKPAFSFDGDSNTGMYHMGADQIGFTIGGSNKVYIEDSTYVLNVLGAVYASGAINAGDATFVELQNTGGAKIEVQNQQDGGTGRGLYMWSTGDPNWVIYMGQAGSGKAADGGTACSGLDGRTSHGIRYRAHDSTSQIGHLFENSSDEALFQIQPDTGNILARGNVTAYASDERLKTNIKPIENPIEKLKKLRGVEFDWIDGIEETHGFKPKCKHETGVIAQEVEQVIPDAISPAPFNNEYKTVEHTKIISLLIESVRSQQETIELLTKRIEEIEHGNN